MSQLATQSIFRVVIYEGMGSQPLAAPERHAAVSALLEKGFAVTCANGKGTPAPARRNHLLVLGQFDRATAPVAEDACGEAGLTFQDITGFAPARIVETAEAALARTGSTARGEWKPWFPVIDYDRCTNCMQCLSFCLFGVYGVDAEKRIQAQNHDNCKTNCPACSRVCPEAAIMFPKYKAGPINGDIVSAADLDREKMKVDISALLGGDVYSLLRDRSERARSRFSKERDADKALKERQKCLTKLAQMGDIPMEVLMSLPSPDEIARRADEAAARARAALAN
jgi:Pyruvate/2-oxoacid:ferredoxin oxidoreductase delta subunit